MSEQRIARRQLLAGAGIAGVGALAALTPTAALAEGDHENGVIGSWNITIKFGNGSVEGVSTFAPGGGFVTTDASGPVTGLGSWRKKGEDGFELTFIRFQFDASGAAAGKVKIRAAGTVSGDSQSGSFIVDVFDKAGNLLVSVPGTFTGTRFAVESL